ncbi:MAG: HAD family phosphatase [Clostridia bacterium]|nr:HAD family phosphatase [Clostridia bacterium]
MFNPKEKCAVFLDIDGTLISDSFRISDDNLKAIAEARARGHMVFINTGRSWGNIPDILHEQLDLDGIISGIGAMVTINGKTVWKICMSEDLVRRVMEYIFSNREYWAIFEGYNNVYSIPNDERDKRNYELYLSSPEDSKTICAVDEIQVIAMGKIVPDDFIELFKDDLTVFQFDTYADCVVKGLNKAKGIEKVLELTGIKRENTIAIGDSNNDYDMLKYAEIGVAMANSQQRILDMADYVTDSAKESGVARAIEKLLLK